MNSALGLASLVIVMTSAPAASAASPSPSPGAATPSGLHPATAVHPPAFSSPATLVWGGLALFVGLAGVLAVAAWTASSADPRETRVRRRLSSYTLGGRGGRNANTASTSALGTGRLSRSAVGIAGRLVTSRDFDVELARRLEAAGIPLKPAEWLTVQTGCGVGLAVLLSLLGGGSLVAGILGLAIGLGLPVAYLLLKESRRSTAFLEQLPDTLQLLAGSLSVGHSLPHAMDAVVREELAPMSAEFNRALVDARLGMPVEDALDGIAARTGSQDFAWVVMAIRIQREVGGNLAEILGTVAGTIRERERLRRQVRSLSAEGRLSAWILGALPPLFATYLVLVRPGYIRPLFTDPIGLVLLAVMLTTMTAGIFWLRKIVRVEV